MRKISLSLLAIFSAASVALYASSAYFSDTETSQGNVLEAGTVDLLIGNESYYNGILSENNSWKIGDLDSTTVFFDFNDLKPGDFGEDTISLRVDTNDAWACSNITLTSSAENDVIEPEESLDTDDNGNWDGELDDELYFIFWTDDGDNVFEDDESILWQGNASELPQGNEEVNFSISIPLADSNNNVWTDEPGPVIGQETYYIGKSWCFGQMTLNPLIQDGSNQERSPADDSGIECDGSTATNISQTDSITGDIEFTAVQERNNSDYECPDCLVEDAWAQGVVSSEQGLRKNGTAILAQRSILSNVLGEPDGDGSAGTGFFSLGFDGILTIEFDYAVINTPKDDLSFHEITNGRSSYPLEVARVEVSQNGVDWFDLGTVTSQDGGGVGTKDLGVLDWIKYLKLTDESNSNLHTAQADGYDIDAIDIPLYNTCLRLNETEIE
ncbi:hypothetical protein ACFL0C_00770 [Patescibacteria group bacterium]